jgi:hypothetical protein
MNYKKFQTFIKGKLFLVGLTFLDKDGNLIEHYQTYGLVEELTDDGLVIIKRPEGTVFQMPYDNKNITLAEKGEYKLKSNGQILSNPDYIMTWQITVKAQNIEFVKKYGYVPPDE